MPEWPEWDAGVAGVVKRAIGDYRTIEPEWPDDAGRFLCKLSKKNAGVGCRTCRSGMPEWPDVPEWDAGVAGRDAGRDAGVAGRDAGRDAGVAGVVKRTIGAYRTKECRSGRTFFVGCRTFFVGCRTCRSGMPDVPDVMPEWPEWDAGRAGRDAGVAGVGCRSGRSGKKNNRGISGGGARREQ